MNSNSIRSKTTEIKLRNKIEKNLDQFHVKQWIENPSYEDTQAENNKNVLPDFECSCSNITDVYVDTLVNTQADPSSTYSFAASRNSIIY